MFPFPSCLTVGKGCARSACPQPEPPAAEPQLGLSLAASTSRLIHPGEEGHKEGWKGVHVNLELYPQSRLQGPCQWP
jgi:hypothetical protein